MKKNTFYLWIPVLIIAFIVYFYWAFVWRFEVYTNDAYVQGNQVNLMPLRDGFVTAIYTDDTFLVKRGQLLVHLNETDAHIELDKAKKNLANMVRNLCQKYHEVFVLGASIDVKTALLKKAKQNYQHRNAVISVRGVSLEDYQNATDIMKASVADLQKTKYLYDKTLAYVQGTSITDHPLIQKAATEVRDAWVKVYRSNIYAPVDGLVAQRTIQVGMWAKHNQAMLSIIPLNQIWVNANFKETQMRHMRIGQKVKVTSDIYGGSVVYHGTIVGLPGGAGNVFSVFPPENLSGNWIKIVQRLPVRIALDPDEIRKNPLRMGLSMEVRASIFDQSGPLVPQSTDKAPHYKTNIYANEERGDRDLIDRIIRDNIDPELKQFTNKPIMISRINLGSKSELRP